MSDDGIEIRIPTAILANGRRYIRPPVDIHGVWYAGERVYWDTEAGLIEAVEFPMEEEA